MSIKIFRDPLYNYISIDLQRDRWLLDLLNCPEVQRLRRIHQLGVSDFTYPGASHTRLSHTLGVLHLMQQVHAHIEMISKDESVSTCRARVLAAAVLHDVGHGPFSHLFEPCLGVDHEEWSVKIVTNPRGKVFKVLEKVDPTLPDTVAQLIEKNNNRLPQWQKTLLSSQIDVDRIDYLRRDSLFTGAGYGHFDWYRLLNTLEFYEDGEGQKDIVWPEKAQFAIEEYIFARYYMYQNVYQHKTTRGVEKLIEAMWKRARRLLDEGMDVSLVPALREFWDAADGATVEQYLAIEEFTVLEQIQRWKDHRDKALSDLAHHFLNRDQFAMIEAPPSSGQLAEINDEWERALLELVSTRYEPAECFCLRDELKPKYRQAYFPERESDEQSARNAIRIKVEGEKKPIEISRLLPRLEPIVQDSASRYRYYVPRDLRSKVAELQKEWPKSR